MTVLWPQGPAGHGTQGNPESSFQGIFFLNLARKRSSICTAGIRKTLRRIGLRLCSLSYGEKKEQSMDFLGGPGVNNTPLNAGDTGSIPGLGRLFMLQDN